MEKQDTSINEEEMNSDEFYWVCTLYCWLAETIFFGQICINQIGGVVSE